MSGPLYSEEDFVIMTTTKQEQYKCLLPSLTSGDEVRSVGRLVALQAAGVFPQAGTDPHVTHAHV